MACSDREKWDSRWAARRDDEPGAPDPFLLGALVELGPGDGRRAVELASGLGRHALELARRGFVTEAWDVSSVALETLERRARAAGLTLGTRCVDLAGGTALGHDAGFDLIVLVNFLDRGLLAACPALLRPGGQLVFTTFTVDWPGASPRREWRLARGELAAGLPGLATTRVEERNGRAGIVARRAAVDRDGAGPGTVAGERCDPDRSTS